MSFRNGLGGPAIEVSREQVALAEVLEQVRAMKHDLLMLCLGLACIEGEVLDALSEEVGR